MCLIFLFLFIAKRLKNCLYLHCTLAGRCSLKLMTLYRSIGERGGAIGGISHFCVVGINGSVLSVTCLQDLPHCKDPSTKTTRRLQMACTSLMLVVKEVPAYMHTSLNDFLFRNLYIYLAIKRQKTLLFTP